VIAPTPNSFKVGLDVVPNLQPAELDHFWERFGTLPCAAGLPEEDAMWLELYKALGMRDALAMGRVAAALLKRGAQAEYVPSYLQSPCWRIALRETMLARIIDAGSVSFGCRSAGWNRLVRPGEIPLSSERPSSMKVASAILVVLRPMDAQRHEQVFLICGTALLARLASGSWRRQRPSLEGYSRGTAWHARVGRRPRGLMLPSLSPSPRGRRP
jgi:hypothetical protein